MSEPTTSEKILAGLAMIAGFAILLPIFAVIVTTWKAWWLYPAWEWYIIPLGTSSISFWHFTALLFLIQVTTQKIGAKKDEKRDWSVDIGVSLIGPMMAWLVLWWMK